MLIESANSVAAWWLSRHIKPLRGSNSAAANLWWRTSPRRQSEVCPWATLNVSAPVPLFRANLHHDLWHGRHFQTTAEWQTRYVGKHGRRQAVGSQPTGADCLFALSDMCLRGQTFKNVVCRNTGFICGTASVPIKSLLLQVKPPTHSSWRF